MNRQPIVAEGAFFKNNNLNKNQTDIGFQIEKLYKVSIYKKLIYSSDFEFDLVLLLFSISAVNQYLLSQGHGILETVGFAIMEKLYLKKKAKGKCFSNFHLFQEN